MAGLPAIMVLRAATPACVRLSPALLALHEQPGRRWTLLELAHCAHLSRTAFLERFQACLGQTPTEYLQGWRPQLAAQKLRETQDSVTQIAMAAGYGNPSAFARAFKRLLGQSPNEFRAAGGTRPGSALPGTGFVQAIQDRQASRGV